MRKPKLYKIGMNSSCFGYRIFGMWLIYAMIHGGIIYLINFRFLLDVDLSDQTGYEGLLIGLEPAG